VSSFDVNLEISERCKRERDMQNPFKTTAIRAKEKEDSAKQDSRLNISDGTSINL